MSQTISQKRKCAPKFKKAPQAPRRFKSAYMFFSTEQHKHIRDELMADGRCEKTTEIAKLVSQAWKKLSDEDRNHWEEKAQQDKARYEVEKSIYTGPWRVPVKKQMQDDPNIPRRPMSAFLAFSHAKRAEVKKKNPELTNAQLSRRLAQLWKEANEEEKREYIDHEYTLRQKYLTDIATWRQVNEKMITDQRSRRENFAMKQVMDGEQSVDPTLLTRHSQPSDDSTSHENNEFRSMSSEQGGNWNPYSDYTAAHYNYPVPTSAGYPPQSDERYAAYPSHPDERYAAYPSHPDERYVAYPQHHYYDSSTYPAPIAPPLGYSHPGEYSPYYPSRNQHSDGEWATEPHVYSHYSDQFRQHRNSAASSRYQGIPFPSPINAGHYESHNEYPDNYLEQLHPATTQNETTQQVSSRHYHPPYKYPYEYMPSSESERRLPEDSNLASNSQLSPKRKIHDDHGL